MFFLLLNDNNKRRQVFTFQHSCTIKLAKRVISSCSICKIGFGKAFEMFTKSTVLLETPPRDRVTFPGVGNSNTI